MTDMKPLRESSRDAFATELLDSAFLDEPPRHALRRTALWLGVGEAAATTLTASSALGAAPAGALAAKAANGSAAGRAWSYDHKLLAPRSVRQSYRGRYRSVSNRSPERCRHPAGQLVQFHLYTSECERRDRSGRVVALTHQIRAFMFRAAAQIAGFQQLGGS